MRILNVTESYAPFFEFGGPPAKVRALSEGLAKRGHDVTVLTADWGLRKRLAEKAAGLKAGHDNGADDLTASDASPFGQRRKVNGVTAIYLANWFHFHATSWNPALGRYLRARLGNFDVAHIFGLYDFFGPRVGEECRKRKIPYVVEPIGMFVPIVRSVWLKKFYHRAWGREMLAGASAVIATAEQERAELVAGGIPAEKIVLRRNGIDRPEQFPARGEFRAKMKIPQKAKLILFLGRLSSKKSPDLLLEAFADAAFAPTRTEQDVHLAFVGPDEAGMLGKLKAASERLRVAERVHFSPAIEGRLKWAAFRDADIFVLPSVNENFGNTAGEAVAAGTPVIVTDQCGIAPILRDRAGMVIKHEKTELAEALKTVFQDAALYERLREGCSSTFESLGWSHPLQETEALYAGLIAK